MLPTYIHPAARCEAAAPGWKSVACAGSCMASKGPPRRVERTRRGIFSIVARGEEPARTDPMTRPDNKPGSVMSAADQRQLSATGSFTSRKVTP